MSEKDKILEKIIELEKNYKQTQEQWTEKNKEVKENKTELDNVQKVYDEIKIQLANRAEKHRDSLTSLKDIERSGKYFKDELDRVKRELARLSDAERIHQEYLNEVEKFRDKCLEAPWRKENRSDGYGAFEHQIEGAIHLAVAGQALLGDKRGLGKSLTGLIYADLKDASKVLVVCPSDTMDNYIREIQLWAPHRRVVKVGKMSKAVRDFFLSNIRDLPEYTLVFNYEAWRKDPVFIQDIIALKADTLIYDEAHKAKTWGTLTCEGILNLRFGLNVCPNCDDPSPELGREEDWMSCRSCGHEDFMTEFCSIKNVLPMTGTPILNRPQELFPHLRMIDPKNFKKESIFLRDFCSKGYTGYWTWQFGAEKELMEKIGPRYIARDRKSAGVIIPPATPVEHIISKEEFKDNYPKQYKAYEQVRDYAELMLSDDVVMPMNYMIVILMRLRQVLTWPAAIELKHKDKDTQIETVVAKLDVFESVKLDKAQEIISDITDEGEAVLAFSMFTEPLYELERRIGHKAASYTGQTPSYKKNKIQLDFDPKTATSNPQWDVLLGTYGAMGTGLNLNRATHEILIDRHWNPAGEDQAEGRIDRIGTTRDTYIHRIMVEGTVDTWMKSLIERKANLIGEFSTAADLQQELYRAIKEGEI